MLKFRIKIKNMFYEMSQILKEKDIIASTDENSIGVADYAEKLQMMSSSKDAKGS